MSKYTYYFTMKTCHSFFLLFHASKPGHRFSFIQKRGTEAWEGVLLLQFLFRKFLNNSIFIKVAKYRAALERQQFILNKKDALYNSQKKLTSMANGIKQELVENTHTKSSVAELSTIEPSDAELSMMT